MTNGYLENVVFLNCSAISVNETDYTIDDVVQGRIAAEGSGTIIAVTYNGTDVGFFGK